MNSTFMVSKCLYLKNDFIKKKFNYIFLRCLHCRSPSLTYHIMIIDAIAHVFCSVSFLSDFELRHEPHQYSLFTLIISYNKSYNIK